MVEERDAGFVVNENKSIGFPTQSITWIGLTVDFKEDTLATSLKSGIPANYNKFDHSYPTIHFCKEVGKISGENYLYKSGLGKHN